MTDREKPLALAERVENAAGPDRKLDAEIAACVRAGLPSRCDWAFKFPKWEGEHGGLVRVIGNVNGNGNDIAGRFTAPIYTKSLFAAMTLVPEGWFIYDVGERVKPIIYRGDQHNHIDFWAEVQHRQGGFLQKAFASTPALAITAAALRATAEGME